MLFGAAKPGLFDVDVRRVPIGADDPTPIEALHYHPKGDGPRPLVVFDGGLTSEAITYRPIAEFLASHGFHAVTIPSVASDGEGPLTFDAAGLRRKLANLQRTVDTATAWPGVASDAVGLAAWSVGGVTTAVLAARTPSIRAVLSLDGGLGYDYGPALFRELTDATLNASFLHMTGTAPNAFPVPKSLEFDGVTGAEAFLAEIRGLNHSHFFFEGGAAVFAGQSGPDAETFWHGHSALLDLSRLYLEHTLVERHDDFLAAANAVDRDVLVAEDLRGRRVAK